MIITHKPVNNHHMLVGVISDTHGHLLPQAKKALEGVDAIIHAGDIGDRKILDDLRRIAPVFAVRGNMDSGGWATDLPAADVVELGEVVLYVLHDLYALDLDPESAGFQAVICGHTHRAAATEKNGVLYLNPGSASLPKLNAASSVALMRIDGKALDVRFVEISDH